MPFGSRSNLFSRRRRNFVNNVDRNLSSSEPDPPKGCPRCDRELFYLDDEKIWACGSCGWGLPDKFLRKHREEEEQRVKDRGDKSKGVITTESHTTKEQDIFVVPKVDEHGKRKDPFDYLRKDDAYLEKFGHVLVKDEIIFQDDKSTVSSNELKRMKEFRNRRTGDSYYIH